MKPYSPYRIRLPRSQAEPRWAWLAMYVFEIAVLLIVVGTFIRVIHR